MFKIYNIFSILPFIFSIVLFIFITPDSSFAQSLEPPSVPIRPSINDLRKDIILRSQNSNKYEIVYSNKQTIKNHVAKIMLNGNK